MSDPKVRSPGEPSEGSSDGTRTVPTQEEVLGYFDRLSNWGRWGPDDQRGTLNFITQDVLR
jgi:hypothetical protein